MSKAGYLEQIEFKIQAHQKTVDALLGEIEKLRNAAEVILELRGNDVGGPVVDITPRKGTGPITIRKIGGPGREAKPDISASKAERMELRQRIEAILRDNGPLLSGEIRHRLDMVDNQHDKAIWNSLWYMANKLNTIVKENGKYRLA